MRRTIAFVVPMMIPCVWLAATLGCGSTSTTLAAESIPANPDGGACPVDFPTGACTAPSGTYCDYVPDGGSSCFPEVAFCDVDRRWHLTTNEPPPSICPAAIPSQGEACTNPQCGINVCAFTCGDDAATAAARCFAGHWQVDEPLGHACSSAPPLDAGATSDAGEVDALAGG